MAFYKEQSCFHKLRLYAKFQLPRSKNVAFYKEQRSIHKLRLHAKFQLSRSNNVVFYKEHNLEVEVSTS